MDDTLGYSAVSTRCSRSLKKVVSVTQSSLGLFILIQQRSLSFVHQKTPLSFVGN